MAKTLEEYKKNFTPIEKELSKLSSEAISATSNIYKLNELICEAAAGIGRAVQDQKDIGETGDTLKDFLKSKDVRAAYETGLRAIRSVEQNEKTLQKLKKQQESKVKTLNAMYNDLKSEIKDRKKKASRPAFKVLSKSLPDLEKLLKTIDATVDESSFAFAEANAGWGKSAVSKFNRSIKEQMAKTRDQRKKEDEDAFDTRRFDLRIVIKEESKFSKKQSAFATVVSKLGELKRKSGTQGEMSAKQYETAFTNLEEAAKDAVNSMAKIYAPYERALGKLKAVDVKTMQKDATGKKILSRLEGMKDKLLESHSLYKRNFA